MGVDGLGGGLHMAAHRRGGALGRCQVVGNIRESSLFLILGLGFFGFEAGEVRFEALADGGLDFSGGFLKKGC